MRMRMMKGGDEDDEDKDKGCVETHQKTALCSSREWRVISSLSWTLLRG